MPKQVAICYREGKNTHKQSREKMKMCLLSKTNHTKKGKKKKKHETLKAMLFAARPELYTNHNMYNLYKNNTNTL